jgi:hypothetical protein
MALFYRLAILVFFYWPACHGVSGDGGWLGWVFGEQDHHAEHHVHPPPLNGLPSGGSKRGDGVGVDLDAVEAPFEMQREDAFLTEVEKYTGLKMSELDRCQHQVMNGCDGHPW